LIKEVLINYTSFELQRDEEIFLRNWAILIQKIAACPGECGKQDPLRKSMTSLAVNTVRRSFHTPMKNNWNVEHRKPLNLLVLGRELNPHSLFGKS
jgi:hypothetical protein